MFKNYLTIAIRNILRHKTYSFINIAGLAVGMAAFILIMLWVQDELSYDRFHNNSDNIYMVLRSENVELGPSTSKLLAPALKKELPEVIDATSFFQTPESFKTYLQYEDKGSEELFCLVDPQFFDIFSFKFKEGNQNSALINPNSIVLTESMSDKYFGDLNALGESLNLTLFGQLFTLKVTGILENIPHNSSIQQDIFIPISFFKTLGINWDRWDSQATGTYILTQSEIDISAMEIKIANCERNNLTDQKLENLCYFLLPLKKIHLHANNIGALSSTGDIKYIYIFTFIAVIILIIACINYMNLTNALALKRINGIGIQKVVGAQRSDLIRQYLGETLILTFIAMGCALILVELLLPVLNQLYEKSLSVSYLSPIFLVMILSTTLITSIISGLYPAIIISGIQPIQILKGKFDIGTSGNNLRKGLIIFQFTLSIIIIICTIIVLSQLIFIQNSKLGYDKENLVCISIKGDIHAQYDAFKNEILKNTDILSISRSEPIDIKSITKTDGFTWSGENGNESMSIWLFHCDSDFVPTYKIEMHEGRFYSEQYSTDKTSAFVLNEAAIKAMGLESPIGKEITLWGRKGKIIGITKNFHFSSFHNAIEPLIFRIPDPKEHGIYYRELSIRIKPNSTNQSLAYLKNTWKSFFPAEPFDYYFVDDQLNTSYRGEQRMGELFRYFSFLAIFIACLGLFGLAAFAAERRTKEIGIRKVLGASVSGIVGMLSKEFIILVLIANVVAWPVAWYAMSRWLQDFAYRIDLGLGSFILAGLLALVIALLTVSWQAIRAATANPVEALRYE